MGPLISIIIPAFNAAATLPMALASLLAQTYSNWEAIVVDDGSQQPLRKVAGMYGDPRISYIRLNSNRGRGYARQVALLECRGDFLAVLDADDWYYPWKLQFQLDVFAEYPEALMVAPGLAIVDKNYSLTGIRLSGDPYIRRYCPPLLGLQAMKIVHAPAMTRMEAARSAGYDPRLRFSEDEKFLMRVARLGPYVIIPNVLYAYSEMQSQSLRKQLRSYSATRKIYLEQMREYPYMVACQVAATWMKSVVYIGAHCAGLDEALVGRRSLPPAETHIQEFLCARETVLAKMADARAESQIALSNSF